MHYVRLEILLLTHFEQANIIADISFFLTNSILKLSPNNKKVTGPLPKFKRMIKGDAYQMMINHISHSITQLGSGDKWMQFEVIILDKDKIYHKFNWQVEKYIEEGKLKDCWLTTMVSNPIPLGSSI